LRNCSGFTAGFTIASISASLGQRSFSVMGLPEASNAERVLLDVEADGAGDGVGHHQRRRREEGLLGIRMDAAVEIAVARQHRRGVQVAVDDLLLDLRIERAAHAIAGGAGEGDDAEAELLQISGSSFASSRYSCTASIPGASEDFTQGLRVRPLAFALRASRPAAITLRGLLVLVQDW
jgi:hypothetical protein